MNDDIETLRVALPKEMARVRDKVLPSYLLAGPAASFAMAKIRQDLGAAANALAEGDLDKMIAAYKCLKETKP